jgi:hypothetical protein
MVGATCTLRDRVEERKTDGGYPGEAVVRLPRRLCKLPYGRSVSYDFDLRAIQIQLNRWALDMPFWPLDNDPPQRLPIEE